MKEFVIKRDDIFPDYTEEMEKTLNKLNDRFGINIRFLFSDGLSISYDDSRWEADTKRSSSYLAIFKDTKSRLDILFLTNQSDEIILSLEDGTKLLTLKKYTE